MDWDVERMCEGKVKDRSRILACEAIKMDSSLLGVGNTVGRGRSGEQDQGLPSEHVKFEKFVSYPDGDVE